MSASRYLAYRTVLVQAVVAVLIGFVFLFWGAPQAQAAAVGGGSVVLGGLLFAWQSLAATAPSAGLALTRLLIGIALKWFVVIGALYVALAQFGLPPLPMLAGLAGTTAASFLRFNFKYIGAS